MVKSRDGHTEPEQPVPKTRVSRLQRAKGQVTRTGDRGAEMPDSEPAAAATGGASQDQSRDLPKERPESPRERMQVDTSDSQRGQKAKGDRGHPAGLRPGANGPTVSGSQGASVLHRRQPW